MGSLSLLHLTSKQKGRKKHKLIQALWMAAVWRLLLYHKKRRTVTKERNMKRTKITADTEILFRVKIRAIIVG